MVSVFKTILKQVPVAFEDDIIFQKVKSSNEAFVLGMKIVKREEMELTLCEYSFVIGFNMENRIIHYSVLSIGGLAATFFDPRILFKHLIKSNCSSFIIFHNHPSGRAIPSESDKVLTKKLKDGGKLLDIILLDHIIICPRPCEFSEDNFSYQYYSFADDEAL